MQHDQTTRAPDLANGRKEIPAFGAVMSQEELRDVAAYLLEDLLRE